MFMIQIVFLEPKTSGNVGAIARVMANFNFKNLILINPKCNHLDENALRRAKRAKSILEKAQILKTIQELKLISDYVVGTTSVLGRDYNISRVPINAEEFGKKIADIEKESPELKISILIGREGDGLANEEILECDFLVTIPTFPDYHSMNASHAASIIFYEIFKNMNYKKIGEHIKPATKDVKDQIMKLVKENLKKMKFATEEKRETQIKVWQKMVGKSFLSKREAMALIGFLKKL